MEGPAVTTPQLMVLNALPVCVHTHMSVTIQTHGIRRMLDNTRIRPNLKRSSREGGLTIRSDFGRFKRHVTLLVAVSDTRSEMPPTSAPYRPTLNRDLTILALTCAGSPDAQVRFMDGLKELMLLLNRIPPRKPLRSRVV
eukprot:708680-Amphidinium_carterae.1